MKKWITAALTIAGLVLTSRGSVIFEDYFNRGNVAATTDGSAFGAGYTISSPAGAGSFELTGNHITGSAVPATLLNSSATTLNSGDSEFSMSVDILAKGSNFSAHLGLAFNDQGGGNFYAARIGTTGWQMLQYVNWVGSTIASGSFSSNLTVNQQYRLTVSSATPYTFAVEVKELGGGTVIGSGSGTDGSSLYQNGVGGIFCSNVAAFSQFDNLSVSVIPEPATIGLFMISGASVLALRRIATR